MSTSPQPRRSSSAPTVLLTLGGVFMLLAVIFSIALYIWGRSGPSYGENWNDLIAAGFIVYGGVLSFVIGLILLVIGLVLRVMFSHGRRLTISQPFLNHIALCTGINFLLREHHIISVLQLIRRKVDESGMEAQAVPGSL